MMDMGGLRKKMPITAATMLIGCLAIAGMGIPLLWIGLSGYYSKDMILEQAFSFARVNPTVLGSIVLRGGSWRSGDHGVLHVPAVVHDVRRSAAGSLIATSTPTSRPA